MGSIDQPGKDTRVFHTEIKQKMENLAVEIRRRAREHADYMHSYMTEIINWESEIKQKEASLTEESQQGSPEPPPIRSRQRKDKNPKHKKKYKKRIASSDYKAWETFDADKACEDIDMDDVEPLSLSLDGKPSDHVKQLKLREEAQQHKEKGNRFVKLERWDDAISCYNRAIELVKDEAIYYANRGLCYLKKESLHQAEADCTEAIRLDPTYVKSWQRRACARERLGSLRSASSDLGEVIKLEPHNTVAKRQLDSIKLRMGTKGRKSKSSPVTTPTSPGTRKTWANTEKPSIEEMCYDMANWTEGYGEDVVVVNAVNKPPHLRSKKPLKEIPIQEIPNVFRKAKIPLIGVGDSPSHRPKQVKNPKPQGKTVQEQPKTIRDAERVPKVDNPTQGSVPDGSKAAQDEKPVQISLSEGKAPRKGKSKAKSVQTQPADSNSIFQVVGDPERNVPLEELPEHTLVKRDLSESYSPSQVNQESVPAKPGNQPVNPKGTNDKDKKKNEPHQTVKKQMMKMPTVAPLSSVQFMADWRSYKGFSDLRREYLKLIDPRNFPRIFANSMESSVLSEIIQVLYDYMNQYNKGVTAYLIGLSRVQRLSALAMFLSDHDRQLLKKLLTHCKNVEDASDGDIADLKSKYEI